MTNRKGFRRACSLSGARTPALLGQPFGSFYGHLEEPELSPGAGAGLSTQAEARQKPAGGRGSRGRRAASLRTRRAAGEEALGEAAHSLGPGDGQVLIGDAPGKTEGKVKKCRKVNRALRQGWETFLSNVSSLTLSPPGRSSRPA